MIPSRHKSLCKPLPPDVQKIIRSGVIISGFVKCVEELVSFLCVLFMHAAFVAVATVDE